MKRFALVLLLALVPLLAGAQSLVIPVYEETPGGTRKWVGTTQPLPVTTVGGGTASTAAAITALAAQQASEALAIQAAIATITLPVSGFSTTFITATETPTLVPLLAGVTEMTLVASSTFEVYLGSDAVTASATSIYNMTLPVSPGQSVYVGQSTAVQPRITIYQVAR
jgi:hypothetical protein